MKLLFLLVVTAIIGIGAYLVSFLFLKGKKKKKLRFLPFGIAGFVVVLLLGLISFGMYSSLHEPDFQCSKTHVVITKPPSNLTTAMDFFTQANYEYDTGNCTQAIASYSKAIELNPTYVQAYNNRGYTYMRLRDYKNALADLNKALQLNPNYVQALMNRGDVHNYYYQIDRPSAIADYKKAKSLGATQNGTSVCGHMFLAEHGGWTLGAFWDFFNGNFQKCE